MVTWALRVGGTWHYEHMTKKLIAAAFISLIALTGCSTTTVEKPTTETENQAAEETKPAAKEGTRENPYPIGSTITQGDWAVTINSVNLDANAALADENLFNQPAPEGSTFIMVNVTATYNGTKADGDYPFISVEYVTAGGNTINSSDTLAVAPEYFDLTKALYAGASTTGNIALAVPTADITSGTLAVMPHMLGDKVFVAVQ